MIDLSGAYRAFCLTLFMLALSSHQNVQAQTNDDEVWWPNVLWGDEDQAGASNWITPDKILQALQVVNTGKLYELGHIYERGMPLYGSRGFRIVIPAPRPGSFGENAGVWHDDFVSGELGQVGTQFDGLGHAGKRVFSDDGSFKDVFYNGFTREDMLTAYGLQSLGVEHVRPIITRGVLLDIAGYKEVETLSSRYEITVADVRGALRRQGMDESDIEPGDAILLNYGWAANWGDSSKYNDARIGQGSNDGSPGIGLEVAHWIVERQASLVGADTCCVEVDPNPDTSLNHPVHQVLLTRNGIYILENLDLRSLAADQAYEFLFIFTPLRLKGATGSPGRPIAIR